MGDTTKDPKDQLEEALARNKEKVNRQVEEHKDEDHDLQDVVGGAATEEGSSLWKISYET